MRQERGLTSVSCTAALVELAEAGVFGGKGASAAYEFVVGAAGEVEG